MMLGIVTNPSGVTRTLNIGVRSQATLPSAPFHRIPGIQPNDFQLAQKYGWYTPVDHGWIVGKNNAWPQGALSDAATTAAMAAVINQSLSADASTDQATEAMLRQLVESEKIKSRMAIVSASAVVLMSLIGVIGFVRSRGKNV